MMEHIRMTALYNRYLPSSGLQSFTLISFLLLFFLSIEHFPIPIQAQIIPLTSILAVLFLPFTVTNIRITPLFRVVVLFVIFTLLHSIVALFIDVIFSGEGEVRIFAWVRQVIALVIGLSVFLVLRRTLVYVSDRFLSYAVIAGALPALTVALLNLFWGLTDNTFAGTIVTNARAALGLGSWPQRASGLSLEPAHFAFYLVIIVIPITLFIIIISRRRLLWLILLILSLIAFIWTVSTSGLIILLCLMLAGILLGPRRDLFIIALFCILMSVIGYVNLFPNSYAVIQIKHLLTGNWTVSAIDRFYSTFGPFINALSSYTLIGYGLGGTSTHFSEIIPTSVQSVIASVRWEEMPNLGNLIGRILAETGLIGLCLFIIMVFIGFQELNSLCKSSISGSEIIFLKVARLAIISFLVGATVGGHGSFALPYLWFWLAVIDSRYINRKAWGLNNVS